MNIPFLSNFPKRTPQKLVLPPYEPSNFAPPLSLPTLCQSWGISSPFDLPPSLTPHATTILTLQHARIGEIIAHLNLAPQPSIDETLLEKPANVLSLEYLSQSIPSIRPFSQQILAISRKIPYFPSFLPFEQKITAASKQLPAAALHRLEQLNAIAFPLTPSPNSSTQYTIAFSNYSNLLEFASASGVNRLQDPLHQAIPSHSFALASPDAISWASNLIAQSDAPINTISSDSQDNFWSSTHAQTDGERTLARILDDALSRKATDIAFAPQRDGTCLVKLRVYGDMTHPPRMHSLSPELNREITNFLITRSRANDGSRLRKPADGQITYKGSSTETFIRCSFIPADHFGLDFDMISTSLRLMPRTSRSINLSNLNIHKKTISTINDALLKTQGLIVLAGPTNSGKSTTIAGIVGEHVKLYGYSKKRLSLEDPVERYLDGITQFTVEHDFASLMRALLRHDPDMVWVGELRDPASAVTCVRASTSGHLVLSTVHANNSVLAFRAIANYLKKETGESSSASASIFDLSESLSLIISQRLVKQLCPHCKIPHPLSPGLSHQITSYLTNEGQASYAPTAIELLSSHTIFQHNPKGCSHCNNLGFIGELPINELLPVTRTVRDLFSQSEYAPLDFNAVAQHRTLTLAESAISLICDGSTDISALFV